MASYIARRKFLATLGGAVAAWPLAARAQQPAMPVIGYLSARSADDTAHLVAAFRRGLGQGGFVEGQNVMIEYRWALGQYDRLPAMAAELARRPVAIFATTGGEPSALAAKAATSTIPIVFLIGGDPVKLGLAASYNRPGGNATGMNILTATMEPKRLGLLRELVPQAATIGILLNPNFQPAAGQLRDLQEAGRVIGQKLHVLHAGTDRDLDASFETIAQQRIAALVVAQEAIANQANKEQDIERFDPLAAKSKEGALWFVRAITERCLKRPNEPFVNAIKCSWQKWLDVPPKGLCG